MVVVVPGKGAFEPLAQRRLKSFPGKTSRDVFGLTTLRRNDPRRQYRGERWYALEGTVSVPKLVRLVAQGKPVIRRHDLAVLVDRAEDHEIGTHSQRPNLSHLE